MRFTILESTPLLGSVALLAIAVGADGAAGQSPGIGEKIIGRSLRVQHRRRRHKQCCGDKGEVLLRDHAVD